MRSRLRSLFKTCPMMVSEVFGGQEIFGKRPRWVRGTLNFVGSEGHAFGWRPWLDSLPLPTCGIAPAAQNNKRTAEKSPEGLDYQWSMVCGPDRSYLWILSRTPTMAPATWKMLTDRARSLGFDVDALVMGQDVAG